MKTLYYMRLAADGIRKNRKIYLPYILSCIGMVMMFYILMALSLSEPMRTSSGGAQVVSILTIGKFVIAAFALIFLFYTNSFLTRKRYKEFGLFNILGMDKNSIGHVIFHESLTVSLAGLMGGIGLGIAFSKLFELALLYVTRSDVNYSFTVETEAILLTAELFGAIFLLLMIKSLIFVRRLKPVDLMKSDAVGEKPPKGNIFFALIGLLLLGGAYYLSVSIESPLTAIFTFFIAVVMVIVATYLLFISGSVALCRLLKKSKRYYYKKNHFISVSSMAYRMKRNGAGLASICILSTMVLVMISSTASLYFGQNDALETRFPLDNELSLELDSLSALSDEKTDIFRKEYEKVFENYTAKPQNVTGYRYCSGVGYLSGDSMEMDRTDVEGLSLDYDHIRAVYFVSLEDFNRRMGTSYTLAENEIMVKTAGCKYKKDAININGLSLTIKERPDEFMPISEVDSISIPTIIIAVSDYSVIAPLAELETPYGTPCISAYFSFGYDTEGWDTATARAVLSDQKSVLDRMFYYEGYSCTVNCFLTEKDDFYSSFGSLFFLGIVLSAVFIFAAVMIIYYKQVSEGYEDKARVEIMQKVGMTEKDIKKSINSQMLTVFFAPLIAAGCHLIFAYPLVWKLLQLFALKNLTFVICVTATAFLLFGVFYAIVYKFTATAYYKLIK